MAILSEIFSGASRHRRPNVSFERAREGKITNGGMIDRTQDNSQRRTPGKGNQAAMLSRGIRTVQNEGDEWRITAPISTVLTFNDADEVRALFSDLHRARKVDDQLVY